MESGRNVLRLSRPAPSERPPKSLLLQEWVKQGMPEGNAKETPAPAEIRFRLASGRNPTLIVEMPTGYHIPADGADIYRNIAIPLGITENKWVTAIDMKPTARLGGSPRPLFCRPHRQGSLPPQ